MAESLERDVEETLVESLAGICVDLANRYAEFEHSLERFQALCDNPDRHLHRDEAGVLYVSSNYHRQVVERGQGVEVRARDVRTLVDALAGMLGISTEE